MVALNELQAGLASVRSQAGQIKGGHVQRVLEPQVNPLLVGLQFDSGSCQGRVNPRIVSNSLGVLQRRSLRKRFVSAGHRLQPARGADPLTAGTRAGGLTNHPDLL